MITLDLSKAKLAEDLGSYKEKVAEIHDMIQNKTGAGNDFLGWVELPENYDKEEVQLMKETAAKLREKVDVLLVCGIGGSYLGARAAIEAINGLYSDDKVEIIYVGNTFSSNYIHQVAKYIEDKDFAINVISKSGTTTEPAIAFRLCKELLIKKYHEKAAERIFATTDAKKGALRNLATQEGYETFVVPDDIGGRYSWFTAVGLLPIACAGIDIDALMKGSYDAMNDCVNNGYDSNDAMKYANMRNLLYKTKQIEILVNFEPRLAYISEWWKQLYGESEGKDHKGLFPASLVYSTDLHSMGQYVQEGKGLMFETVLNVLNPEENLILRKEAEDLDQLNYLDQTKMDSVAKKAMQGTILAHVDGGVPNLVLEVEEMDAYHLGYLLYFFMFACGVSGYMLGVNPFNQPGVEAYKKNMFALLGKPGYEELSKQLKNRL